MIEEMKPDVVSSGNGDGYAYEKCIVLPSRDLSNLCRLIDPLTKSSLDECGRSVYFTCLDEGRVEVRYYNQPYVITSVIANSSGKMVKDFAILVSTLKNLLSNSFSSIVLVEQGDEIDLLFGDQLIYLETKKFRKELYLFDRKEVTGKISHEDANYVFRTVGAILNQTDRASEKVIVVKDGTATFNTGVFAASIRSPFGGGESMVIYKQVSDAIATLSEVTKEDIGYGISKVLVVRTANFYCEFPVGLGEKINAFVSPSTKMALKFDARIRVNDDSLYTLVKLVQSLDYLSDVIRIRFVGNDMVFELSTQNNARTFTYKFPVLEGAAESSGDMSIPIGVFKVFLDIVGDSVLYSFNDMGLGIANDRGAFLIRKS